MTVLAPPRIDERDPLHNEKIRRGQRARQGTYSSPMTRPCMSEIGQLETQAAVTGSRAKANTARELTQNQQLTRSIIPEGNLGGLSSKETDHERFPTSASSSTS